jgi:hypothetical protein
MRIGSVSHAVLVGRGSTARFNCCCDVGCGRIPRADRSCVGFAEVMVVGSSEKEPAPDCANELCATAADRSKAQPTGGNGYKWIFACSHSGIGVRNEHGYPIIGSQRVPPQPPRRALSPNRKIEVAVVVPVNFQRRMGILDSLGADILACAVIDLTAWLFDHS